RAEWLLQRRSGLQKQGERNMNPHDSRGCDMLTLACCNTPRTVDGGLTRLQPNTRETPADSAMPNRAYLLVSPARSSRRPASLDVVAQPLRSSLRSSVAAPVGAACPSCDPHDDARPAEHF